MSYINEVEENNGSERAEEVVEFVNFPDTAFEITRAIAIDSGLMFEPMRFEPMAMDWEPVQLNETAVARKPEIVFEVVASPCPGKPLRLPPQCHGYCQQSSYDVLSKDVESSLCSLAQFDFSYDAASCLWRGKSILGARCLEVLVSCYWDAKKADHLLTVTKVAGDMYQLCPMDVFQQLQSCLRLVVPGASSVAGSSSSTRVAVPAGPPALRRSGAGAPIVPPSLKRSNPSTQSSNCTNSLQQIVTMLQGQQIDVHTEAARMFYDLMAAHPTPADSEQERLIAEIVVLLLDSAQELDEELQVVSHQCVVLALQTMGERNVSATIFTPFVVSFLWKVILVDGVDATKDYLTIAIRRTAVHTMAAVLASASSSMAFPRDAVAQLRDVKLQQLCMQQLLPLCK